MSSWRDTTCGALAPGRRRQARDASPAGRTRVATTAGSSSSTCATTREGAARHQPRARAERRGVAHEIRNEFVLQAEGEVVRRAQDAVNPNILTGEIEIQVDTLTIVSRSEPLPFQIDEENVDEVLRLRYR